MPRTRACGRAGSAAPARERPRPLPGGTEAPDSRPRRTTPRRRPAKSCSGSDMPTGDRRATCSTTCLPLPSGSINPRTYRRTGIVGRERDLVGNRGNLSSRLLVQPLPVGAHGDRAERLEGSLPSPLSASSRAIRAKSRIVAEPDHVLSAISRWNEAIACSAGRKADLLRRSEQTHAVARTADARAPGRLRGRAAVRGAVVRRSALPRARRLRQRRRRPREALPGLLQRRAPQRPRRPARMRPRRGARRHGPAQSASASASAACAFRSSSAVAACSTAERINGCRNRNLPDSSVPRPAATAGAGRPAPPASPPPGSARRGRRRRAPRGEAASARLRRGSSVST